jgi:hypothetical protein
VRGEIDAEAAKQIAETVQCNVLLLVTISEFGKAPEGGTEGGVTVALDARLVEVSEENLSSLWAYSTTTTGRESASLFRSRRAPSLAALCHRIAADMARSLVQKHADIVAALAAPPVEPVPLVGPTEGPGPGPAVGAGASDETHTYTPEQLQAFLTEAPGFTREALVYTRHYFGTVETRYRSATGFVEVQLVDYEKAAPAKKFVSEAHEGTRPTKVGQAEGYARTTHMEGFLLDVCVGRFGLYFRGAVKQEDEVRKLAAALVGGLQ